MERQPSFAAAWYAQTARAAAALARVHDEELRRLSDDEALSRADALLSIRVPLSEERRKSSGLVAQQVLFSRSQRPRAE